MKENIEQYLTQIPPNKYIRYDNPHQVEKQYSTHPLGLKEETEHKKRFAYSPFEQRAYQREKDLMKLQHCALLHTLLVKKVTEHLQEKMIGEGDQKIFENMIFDLQIAKRGLKLIERFYRDLGFSINN